MIVNKPKLGSLFSLTVFLVLIYSAIGYQLIHFRQAIYQYILLIILTPIALGVTFKILWGFKTVRIEKGNFYVSFPFRFQKYTKNLSELKAWKQDNIQTKNGLYKQVKVEFEDGKHFTMSMQEYSNYERTLQYLKKKSAKKELKN